MCIALLTTAHPDYALIIIDNRDEFILRPTTRPHWWNSQHQEILSSRDLEREEQGTWLGITRNGNLAVLTNYRETDTHDKAHPVSGLKSRGRIVTAWLANPENESTEQFVHRLFEGDGVHGVGGFSLVCGKLRRTGEGKGQNLKPLAIISNRSGSPDAVPWIAGNRGEVYGLSNTLFEDPETWPKVQMGKEVTLKAVKHAVEAGQGEDELVRSLFTVLDIDTLPPRKGSEDFEKYMYQLRKSIFIPAISYPVTLQDLPKAAQLAAAVPNNPATPDSSGDTIQSRPLEAVLKQEKSLELKTSSDMTIYGTQRQTIVLVDWEGRVIFTERSLWDAEGNPIERGTGDMKFEFQIEGWNRE